jgi:hydrogenase expression/formation protein HypE
MRGGVALGAALAQPGDVVLVNGRLGDHGAAILAARGDLALDAPIDSDCAPLNGLVAALLDAAPQTRFLRDATRGGVATVLNEIAEAASVEIALDETAIPMHEAVKGFCEILGLDPLYLANEGKLVAIVPDAAADAALAAMRAHPLGRDACAVGRVVRRADPRVVMRTALGGSRIVDMLVGDQLPRIC